MILLQIPTSIPNFDTSWITKAVTDFANFFQKEPMMMVMLLMLLIGFMGVLSLLLKYLASGGNIEYAA